MASRLHSKNEKKKQEKIKRVSHLRDVEDMFFRLTMWNYFFLLRGKLKIKHLSLFITGGGERKNEGGSHGFQGNRGEKQLLLTRYKGGALRNIACQWRGSLKYYKALEGGPKVNFRVIQQKSSHPLPRQYIQWLVPNMTKPAWTEY